MDIVAVRQGAVGTANIMGQEGAALREENMKGGAGMQVTIIAVGIHGMVGIKRDMS